MNAYLTRAGAECLGFPELAHTCAVTLSDPEIVDNGATFGAVRIGANRIGGVVGMSSITPSDAVWVPIGFPGCMAHRDLMRGAVFNSEICLVPECLIPGDIAPRDISAWLRARDRDVGSRHIGCVWVRGMTYGVPRDARGCVPIGLQRDWFVTPNRRRKYGI